MVVVAEEQEMVDEVAQVVHHHSVHIVLLLVEQVVNQIVHMKVDMVELLLVETSIFLVVAEKCHMTTTEKVVEVHHSGIKQVHHTIMLTTKKKSLMVNGGLEEDMDIILKIVTHTITQEVVRVA